jgi:hypothetical protein
LLVGSRGMPAAALPACPGRSWLGLAAGTGGQAPADLFRLGQAGRSTHQGRTPARRQQPDEGAAGSLHSAAAAPGSKQCRLSSSTINEGRPGQQTAARQPKLLGAATERGAGARSSDQQHQAAMHPVSQDAYSGRSFPPADSGRAMGKPPAVEGRPLGPPAPPPAPPARPSSSSAVQRRCASCSAACMCRSSEPPACGSQPGCNHCGGPGCDAGRQLAAAAPAGTAPALWSASDGQNHALVRLVGKPPERRDPRAMPRWIDTTARPPACPERVAGRQRAGRPCRLPAGAALPRRLPGPASGPASRPPGALPPCRPPGSTPPAGRASSASPRTSSTRSQQRRWRQSRWQQWPAHLQHIQIKHATRPSP